MIAKDFKLISGSLSANPKDYVGVELENCLGQRLVAVGYGTSDSLYEEEPVTILFFENKTRHTFVHPGD